MSVPYEIKKLAFDQLLALGVLKAMVLNSTHVTDLTTQSYADDVNANEVSGTNYAAGGINVGTVTTSVSGVYGQVDGDDLQYVNVTITNARFICYYIFTGDLATSPILDIIDMGADVSKTAENLDIVLSTSYITRIGV